MIHSMHGTVSSLQEQAITLMINGLEFFINVPQAERFTVTTTQHLYIHFHWNQENGPTLYGFNTILERELFLLIINCSGIGPRIGLAILAHLGATEFIRAIQAHEHTALSSVPGIGSKKAEQLMVHARHRLEKLLEQHTLSVEDPLQQQWNNLNQVLHSLNYSRSEISQAVQYVRQQVPTQAPFDHMLRTALTYLSKRI